MLPSGGECWLQSIHHWPSFGGSNSKKKGWNIIVWRRIIRVISHDKRGSGIFQRGFTEAVLIYQKRYHLTPRLGVVITSYFCYDSRKRSLFKGAPVLINHIAVAVNNVEVLQF
jgi:hypothetical protein